MEQQLKCATCLADAIKRVTMMDKRVWGEIVDRTPDAVTVINGNAVCGQHFLVQIV